MDLVLVAAERDGVPVLAVHGEIDLATVPRLRNQLVALNASYPGVTLVVDLDGVSALDATGLGVLVGGLGQRRWSGGDLVLVCASPALRDHLALCRLDRVFEIHETATAAIASVVAGRGAVPGAEAQIRS
jgi:anti-sigma B factor antagonist